MSENRLRNLAHRTARVWLSVELGLRNEDECAWLQEHSQPLMHAALWPSRVRDLSEHVHPNFLNAWEQELLAVEERLLVLEADTLKKALEICLAKPFDPTPEQISRTLSQMGSWDNPATFQDAEELLKKEFDQHQDMVRQWRQELDGPPVRRPRP